MYSNNTCPNCGRPVSSMDAFCPNCGKRLKMSTTCPVCGNELNGAKFCAKCGYNAGNASGGGSQKAKNGVKKVGAFFAKYKKLFIALAAVILIAIIVIPTAVTLASPFRQNKVNKVELGVSTKNDIKKTFGDPTEEYRLNAFSGADAMKMFSALQFIDKGKDVWVYYDSKIAKKIDKINQKMENAEDFDDFDKLDAELERATKNPYKSIVVAFDDDGKVTFIALNTKTKYDDTDLFATSESKTLKSIDLSQNQVCIDTSIKDCNLTYTAKFSDKSIIKGYLTQTDNAVDTSKQSVQKVTFNNGWGNYSANVNIVGHNLDGVCVCKVCGNTFHELNQDCRCTECGTQLQHRYVNCVCTNCGNVKHTLNENCECTVCHKVFHEFSDWETEEQPTCTANGSEYRTCYNCDKREERTISALGHKYSTEWNTDATCTESGTKWHQCVRCKDKQDITEAEALGHDYSTEWTIDEEPTCTEAGSKSHHCTRCNDKQDVTEIEALGHNYSTEWTIDKEHTCIEAGSKSHHCTRCNDKQDVTEIEALGHNYSTEWTIDKEHTCIEAGSKSHHCTRCNDKQDVTEIPALGHDENEDGVCNRCEKLVNYDKGFSEKGYIRKDNNIYFGTYPQSKVTDSTLTSALTSLAGTLPTSSNSANWTSYGYYISGSVRNFMWYIDKEYKGEKYRGVYFTSYRPYYCSNSSSTDHTYQDDNGYYTSTVYWFKYEPIKWRILKESDGKALILADLAIDSQQYYHSTSNRTVGGNTVYPNNYAESDIRKWLNDTFYNTAFTSLQKGLIEVTNVDNSVSSTGYSSNQYACENTNDNVFLLSYKEVSTYLKSDTERQMKSSDYAKSQGVYASSSYDGACWWWLRSPLNYIRDCARYVGDGGYIDDYSSVRNTDYGVLPALVIRLS